MVAAETERKEDQGPRRNKKWQDLVMNMIWQFQKRELVFWSCLEQLWDLVQFCKGPNLDQSKDAGLVSELP